MGSFNERRHSPSSLLGLPKPNFAKQIQKSEYDDIESILYEIGKLFVQLRVGSVTLRDLEPSTTLALLPKYCIPLLNSFCIKVLFDVRAELLLQIL